MRDERWRRWRLFENQPASERTTLPVADSMQGEAAPNPAAPRLPSTATSGVSEEMSRC